MTCWTAGFKWLEIRLPEIRSSVWISGYSDKSLLVLGWTLILGTTFRGTFCWSWKFCFDDFRLQLFQWVLADNISVDSPSGWLWLLIACVGTYCRWDLLAEDVNVGCWVVILQKGLLLIVGSLELTHSCIIIVESSFVAHIPHTVKLRGLVKVHEGLLLFL